MIKGYQFDRETVTPLADARLYEFLAAGRNVVLPGGMNITTNGLVATISTGGAVIKGRYVEITSPETLTLPANQQGFICITIDLSQVNSSAGDIGTGTYISINRQVRVEFVASPKQQDINGTGTLFNFQIAHVVTTGAAVTIINPANRITGMGDFPYPVNLTGGASVSGGLDVNGILKFESGAGVVLRRLYTFTGQSVPAEGTVTLPIPDADFNGAAIVSVVFSFGNSSYPLMYAGYNSQGIHARNLSGAAVTPTTWTASISYISDGVNIL